MSDAANKLLTAEEVAKILQVKRQTVYTWARERKIPSLRLGRLTRFRVSDFCNFEWVNKSKKGCT